MDRLAIIIFPTVILCRFRGGKAFSQQVEGEDAFVTVVLECIGSARRDRMTKSAKCREFSRGRP